MRNRTITKKGIDILMNIKALLLKAQLEMENLKVVDVGSDWIMISLSFYPCYREISKFVGFIDDYLSDSDKK